MVVVWSSSIKLPYSARGCDVRLNVGVQQLLCPAGEHPVKDWMITDTTMQLGSCLGMVFTSTAESFSYRNTVTFYDAPTGFFIFSLYSRSCETSNRFPRGGFGPSLALS
ncbi:hypothetical protein Pelo_19911 [Pelomyxa schiedti]|nr:hypothetical protein Pelo_19911 [Pelomyxa schiedti]